LLAQIVQHDTTTALMRLDRPSANPCAIVGALKSKIVAAMQQERRETASLINVMSAGGRNGS